MRANPKQEAHKGVCFMVSIFRCCDKMHAFPFWTTNGEVSPEVAKKKQPVRSQTEMAHKGVCFVVGIFGYRDKIHALDFLRRNVA
jgi:hypothetical protein